MFQVCPGVSLWSEYAPVSFLRVEKKKIAVPAKMSAELQNLWTTFFVLFHSKLRRLYAHYGGYMHIEHFLHNFPNYYIHKVNSSVLCFVLLHFCTFALLYFCTFALLHLAYIFSMCIYNWKLIFPKCIFPKCIHPKCMSAKCTRLACLLSFASLFVYPPLEVG